MDHCGRKVLEEAGGRDSMKELLLAQGVSRESLR